MLLSFTVENFTSIQDLQTLSLEAGSGDHLEWSNLTTKGKRRILKCAAIYGPNASGKSNLITAMRWFGKFVENSSKESQSGNPIPVEPFLLNSHWANAPSHFEIEFLIDTVEYRYGFAATHDQIHSEWLFRKNDQAREARLFTRQEQDITPSPKFFAEGKGLEKRTRKEALFLSVCAQFNGDISISIMEWMAQFRFASGLSEKGFFSFTANRLQSKQYQKQLVEFARKADFNIQNVTSSLADVTEDELPSGLSDDVKREILNTKPKIASIATTHAVRNESGKVINEIEFDLQENESEGTQKFIALAGPILHTLEEGSILVVDELEARLHPRLTQAIVDLFHSPANRKNAQLIFATHDVTLMEPERFRRDQIWFCEKDEKGTTNLYSLADFSSDKVRPTSKFNRQYLKGLFGAVPKLAHFEEAVTHATKK